MEAKSPNLQGELASWGPGRATNVVPVPRPAGLRPRQSLKRKKLMSHFGGSHAGCILFYAEEGQPFRSILTSTYWIKPTYIREGNLLYSVHRFKH